MADLERQCEWHLFIYLTRHIEYYDQVAQHLGLTNPEIVAIRSDQSTDISRRFAVLSKWLSKNGSDATYLHLIEVFLQMENRVLAEKSWSITFITLHQ